MNISPETLRTWSRDPRARYLAALIAVVVVGLVAFAMLRGGSSKVQPTEPAGFSVSPEGDDVARLSPVKVTFASAPNEKDAAKLLTIEPKVAGQYAWLSERTVLFQPDFPGLLRGATYTIHVPARPETGLQQAVQKEFTTSGLLKVVQAIPADGDREVPTQAQVLVQFSRSVAPLTTLAAARKDPVVAFDPPLEGNGEWLNTSLYQFVPKTLAPNTTYHLKIAAGLTSEADGVLKEDYAWSFTTVGPAISSIKPDQNTVLGAPRQPVAVVFNQAMDHTSVEAGLKLLDPNGTPVAGAYTWSSGGETVTFTPAANMAPGKTYSIVISKGLKGAGGGETKDERKTFFTVAPLPAVSSTRPANGETAAERFGVQLNFATPIDPDLFRERISITGFSLAEIQDGMYPGGDERNLYISVRLKPSTRYTVNVAGGAVDRFGQELPAYTFSFTTGSLTPSVSLAIPNNAGTYAASAEPILYYHATNVSSASFTLYPLTATEAHAWFINDFKFFNDPGRWVPSQKAIRTWTEPVSAAKDVVAIESASLSGGGPLPKGYYFVRTGGTLQSYFAFAVVDTEIVLKLSQDELMAWVIDHDTGKPVSGATLAAEGDGLSSTTATTDANGLASFGVPAMTPGKGFNRNYLVMLDNGGRRGIATTQWQQGAYPYQMGIPLEYFTREYVANVFTDRPIYRPGETVNFKAIVRSDDDAAYNLPPANPGLDLVIVDSQGKELNRQPVTLNDFGSFAGSFTLPADAATGDYGMHLDYQEQMKRGYGVSGTSFLVAEFRKPEFQVEVNAVKPAYVSGDSIDVTTKASFFFGGGLANAPVDWSALASPFTMTVKGYERYSFSDWDYWRESIVKQPARATGRATTDAGGVASFAIPATLSGTEGAQTFTISANVTDQSAQAVAGSTSVTVHPASLQPGIHPVDYVAKSGSASRIELVSVDLDGKPVANQQVTVKVYNRKWVTTKEQTSEGARRYRSEPQDTLVDTLTATTDSKGEATVEYTVKNSGTLRLVAEITDGQGRTARSAAYLWCWGGEFASWQVTNDDTVKLVADRDSYSPGDTAKVLVPAPFEGAKGLVTVERGKIISRELRDFPTNAETLDIPIVDGSVPNVFVSVVLYRPPTTADPVPRYKVGYVELPVSNAGKALHVEIKPGVSQAKPGDTVHYDLKVTDAAGKGVKAELSVSVIDKALLTLEQERALDGLKAFWFERGLSVTTSSSLSVSVNRSNDVIAEPPAGGKGGGGLSDDRLRQDFRNSAFWQAQLVTKDDGTASVDVKMPDNLTTWHMDVRAISGDALVGEGQNEIISTQPLLLRPALPRFLRVGDTVTLRMLVRNATAKSSDVTVALDAQGVEVTGNKSKTAKIEPGQSLVFEWPAKVTAEGTAKLTFTATGSGGLKDSVVQEIPISLDVTPETTATGGVVIGEALSEAIYLPAFAILEGGSLEVTVQPALAGSAAGELKWLAPRPYEYSPQIAARLMATVGVRRADKSADKDTSGYDSRIATDVAALIGQQKPGGGWGWCAAPACLSDPNVTAWALLALGEARRDGIAIPDGTVSSARSFVNAFINRVADVEHPVDPSQKAYMTAALALAGDSSAQSVGRSILEQYRTQLSTWGRAYLLMTFAEGGARRDDPGVTQIINDLTASAIASANGSHWEDPRNENGIMTNTSATALVLDAILRVYPDRPLVNQTVRWLTVARGEYPWHTSVEYAQGILALSDFSAKTGELGGNFGFKVQRDGSDVMSGRFQPGDGAKTESKKLPLTDFTAGKTSVLTFLRDFNKPGRLYYTLNLRYLTPAPGVEAVSRGFGVSHQYTLLDDPKTPVDKAKLGDTVRVTVTIVAEAERHYAVIDDLLPAGLEAVDTRLQSVDAKLKAELDAERLQAAKEQQGGYFAPWFGWYYSPWQHVDARDDRVTLFAGTLPKGVYQYIYYARATTPGEFFVPPVHAEESYFPEVFGRSDSGTFAIGE